MNIPDNLYYSADHEWIRVEEDHAYIGITDFAQGELGDIVFVDIAATAGAELQKGTVFGTVEAVKTVSDLFMPVSGILVVINPAINDNPEKINHSPYEDGWMIKIILSNREELTELLPAAEYKSLVG